jgi:Ser/Thr protein kinase RdoA (MazF antagonist)
MKENLDTPIAYGRTAEIYAWHNEKVLKLFYDWFELDDIKYELQIARAIQASGLPVPFVGEIIQINGRNGLTYQRIEGVSMLELMVRKPWNGFYYARRMAELHAKMHADTVQVDIPPLRQKIAYKINHAKALTADLRLKTLDLLEKMPEGNRLCHGDYHPNNILLTKQGEVIIDWIDSALGNPLADLARTTIITLGAIETNQIKNPFLKIFIRIFHRIYIRRYFAIHGSGEYEYSLWLPIVAAARLSENITELDEWLIAQVEKGLSKSMPNTGCT